MTARSAVAAGEDVGTVVSELHAQLAGLEPTLVIFFASPKYAPEELATAMAAAFPGAQTFGCTTAGEIASATEDLTKGSVVAMAMDGDTVRDCWLTVLPDGREKRRVATAFRELGQRIGTSVADLPIDEYVGLILCDGMAATENLVMEHIGDLTDMPFVGGSAGDDLAFKRTHIYANGRCYTDGAIGLCVLRPTHGYEIVKSQSFRPLPDPPELVATKVDLDRRAVLEFNGKPALHTYLDALGAKAEDIEYHFDHNPVGLMIDGEPWVRGPQRADGEAIIFYSDILPGTRLRILEQTDILHDTAADLGAAKDARAVVNFNCIQRTLELERQGKTRDYAAVFSGVETVGFSTYGEQYLGHLNMTATMLVLR
jgi:hypothetical protein